MKLTDKDLARFKGFTSKTRRGCWEWTSITTNGYGRFKVQRKFRLAHRVAYEMSKGPIPDGLVIRHTCDNKRCVNPEHLLVGTNKQNTADMIERGRAKIHGHKNGMSKLTVKDILRIRRLYVRRAKGVFSNSTELRTHYKISMTTFNKIVNRKAWAHVP